MRRRARGKVVEPLIGKLKPNLGQVVAPVESVIERAKRLEALIDAGVSVWVRLRSADERSLIKGRARDVCFGGIDRIDRSDSGNGPVGELIFTGARFLKLDTYAREHFHSTSHDPNDTAAQSHVISYHFGPGAEPHLPGIAVEMEARDALEILNQMSQWCVLFEEVDPQEIGIEVEPATGVQLAQFRSENEQLRAELKAAQENIAALAIKIEGGEETKTKARRGRGEKPAPPKPDEIME